MNEGLRKVALWLRDLLEYDEGLILIGRRNFEREDFETDYITVDTLGQGVLKGSGTRYDSEAEAETLTLLYSFPVTLNFYGSDAHSRAMRLVALRRSQESHELQRDYGVVVHSPESITDAKALTGQQYGERIEVVLNAEYEHAETLDRKRIDNAQTEILPES